MKCILFRLAKALDLPTVYCMDAYGSYLYDTLVSTAQKYGQHEKFDSDMKRTFASVMLQDSLGSTLSIRERLRQMTKLINTYSKEQLNKEFPKQYMNRNVRDVLGHLHHWHLMFLVWYQVGMSGEKPDMPAKNFTWKMTPELNKSILQRYSKTDLQDVSKRLK